ncbi:hypothetical protein [Gaopeijia maritima]|uniref:hypothetical protein n=1 Tax=Gaopeijia maritima TaxID=3119007 RepID=UPI003288DC87
MNFSLPFLSRPGVFALAASLAAAPLSAQTAAVDGAWQLTLATPRGEQTFELTLEQVDAAFTGTAEGPMGEMPVTDGVIEGDSITFVVTMTMGRPGGGGQGRTLEQTFRGVLADGGVTGEVEMPAMGGPGGRGGGGGGGGGGARPAPGPRTFTMVRPGG